MSPPEADEGFTRQHFRHEIDSAARKWMAAQQPLCGEKEAVPRAMPCDRFLRVIRARGIELARAPEKRRKEHDVETDEGEQQRRRQRSRPGNYVAGFSRGSSFSNSCVSAENSAVAAELRG